MIGYIKGGDKTNVFAGAGNSPVANNPVWIQRLPSVHQWERLLCPKINRRPTWFFPIGNPHAPSVRDTALQSVSAHH